MLTAASTEQLATRRDLAELRAELRADFEADLYQQTRSYITWMFGMLAVYTAMAPSFIALAAIFVAR